MRKSIIIMCLAFIIIAPYCVSAVVPVDPEPKAILYGPSPADSETDGNAPANWDEDTSAPPSVWEVDDGDVISPYDGTKCILMEGVGATQKAHYNLTSGETTEPVFVALYVEAVTDNLYFATQDTKGDLVIGSCAVWIQIDSGYCKYYDGSWHNLAPISSGWIYLMLIQDFGADTFDCWNYSGGSWVSLGGGLGFRNSCTDFESVQLAVGTGDRIGLDAFQIGNASGDSTPPDINSVTETTDPTEYNTYLNITANVTDDTAVNTVYLNISHPNGTYWTNTSMATGSGDNYHDNNSYSAVGWYNYTIWVNDTADNSNSSTGSFNITDTTAPVFMWTYTAPNPVLDSANVNHSVKIHDYSTLSAVYLHVTDPLGTPTNNSMTYYAGNENHSISSLMNIEGAWVCRVWATDIYGNVGNQWMNVTVTVSPSGGGGSSVGASFGFEYDINIRTVYFTYVGDTPQAINWAYGDGYGSNITNPIHEYDKPGFYNVTLEVTINGASMFTTKMIKIEGPSEIAKLSGGSMPMDRAGALLIASGFLGLILLHFRFNPLADIFAVFKRQTMYKVYTAIISLGIFLLIIVRVYGGG